MNISELRKNSQRKFYESEIGRIPKEWNVAQIKNVGEIITGNTPSTKHPEYYGDTYMFVAPGDIGSSKYVRKTEKYLSGKGFEISRKVPQNSIMMICIGSTIGKIAIASEMLTTNQQINSIIPNEIYNNEYVYYALNYYFNKIKESKIEKQAVPIISKSKFSEICIPHIEKQEQRKIADILSAWDKAIELKEKLIEQKKEQKRGLMNKLLTGKLKLSGFNNEWTLKRLKEICIRIIRKNNGQDVPVLTISSLSGFLDQSERFSKVIAGKNVEKYTLLKHGEFSYNKGNSKTYPYGCIFRLEDYEEALVPNVYISFSMNGVDSNFYKYYFEAGLMNDQLAAIINTGVRNDGLLNLNADEFFDITLPVPSEYEQKQIGEILDVATKEINLHQQELEALKLQKKGLMQLLLTGIVRVNN
ncbi:restriction endonuclease subunit S [Acetivibrio cellulolyticus]|uniref:restriction endonuclease subunit S n=1 Tax=Acetivibrio cellulolyticus TaxID=35830 RepID=UPI0001E2BE6C|nr:restriction endonuclease subunit S [Acetivibrio cellulolyticus]